MTAEMPLSLDAPAVELATAERCGLSTAVLAIQPTNGTGPPNFRGPVPFDPSYAAAQNSKRNANCITRGLVRSRV